MQAQSGHCTVATRRASLVDRLGLGLEGARRRRDEDLRAELGRALGWRSADGQTDRRQVGEQDVNRQSAIGVEKALERRHRALRRQRA